MTVCVDVRLLLSNAASVLMLRLICRLLILRTTYNHIWFGDEERPVLPMWLPCGKVGHVALVSSITLTWVLTLTLAQG